MEEIRYNTNGKVLYRVPVNEKNEWDGLYKQFNSNGILECSANYNNGECNGLFIFYFYNGSIKNIENYKNNDLIGMGCSFTQDSKIFDKKFYI
jgi:antitoxin component YwqK of YwqJK toxin-antitoxin module